MARINILKVKSPGISVNNEPPSLKEKSLRYANFL